jgi:hypothetical protein
MDGPEGLGGKQVALLRGQNEQDAVVLAVDVLEAGEGRETGIVGAEEGAVVGGEIEEEGAGGEWSDQDQGCDDNRPAPAGDPGQVGRDARAIRAHRN